MTPDDRCTGSGQRTLGDDLGRYRCEPCGQLVRVIRLDDGGTALADHANHAAGRDGALPLSLDLFGV
jgi:hypothetical protein